MYVLKKAYHSRIIATFQFDIQHVRRRQEEEHQRKSVDER